MPGDGGVMFDFETLIEREGTLATKWDSRSAVFGRADVIPLWVADMDFASPPCVVDALKRRAAHPIYGYPARPGVVFEALAGWFRRRYGVEVETEWMSCVSGIVFGLHLALEAFSDAGDGIIIQPPVYHPFFYAIANRKRRLIENPLRMVNGRYEMDFEDLKAKIDDRTRMLILCSPHNPVGRVWSAAELQELARICRERGVMIIADEIHGDLVYRAGDYVPFFSLSPEAAHSSLSFVSGSKTFNLAGLFSSLALAPNPAIRRKFEAAVRESGQDQLNVFGIEALRAAYEGGDAWLDSLLAYLHGNARFVSDYLRVNLPTLSMPVPEGTYLGWIDCRGLEMPQEALNQLMIQRAGLGFNSGTLFGRQGAGFMRINFGCPRGLLEQAMTQLSRALG